MLAARHDDDDDITFSEYTVVSYGKLKLIK